MNNNIKRLEEYFNIQTFNYNCTYGIVYVKEKVENDDPLQYLYNSVDITSRKIDIKEYIYMRKEKQVFIDKEIYDVLNNLSNKNEKKNGLRYFDSNISYMNYEIEITKTIMNIIKDIYKQGELGIASHAVMSKNTFIKIKNRFNYFEEFLNSYEINILFNDYCEDEIFFYRKGEISDPGIIVASNELNYTIVELGKYPEYQIGRLNIV